MARITAPVKGFSGKVVGVDFVDGSGETDDERAIDYFSRQGYTVEGAGDGYGAFEDESKLAPIGEGLGTAYADIDSGAYRDAADPRNEMVPVGGVKADGTVVAGKGRGKRVAAAEASGSTTTGKDDGSDAPAPAPGQPVQELGDPSTKSATPAGTNPVEATAEQGETKAGTETADTGSESASGSKGSSTKAGA